MTDLPLGSAIILESDSLFLHFTVHNGMMRQFSHILKHIARESLCSIALMSFGVKISLSMNITPLQCSVFNIAQPYEICKKKSHAGAWLFFSFFVLVGHQFSHIFKVVTRKTINNMSRTTQKQIELIPGKGTSPQFLVGERSHIKIFI